MNSEIKSLYERGFALHWCHPRSKKPVEAKWTSGERKNWKDLLASRPKNANVGVRLGSPSKIDDHFLAVIDCDVKSADPRHLEEMEEKFRSLFGDQFENAPRVSSGRGNGSRHVYVVTKTPARAQRLGQSPEKVKVIMPSAIKASKDETAKLTPAEIEKGVRLRAAWEISLMGEGQQVVLPPSIHPDSGKPYTWDRPIEAEIPFMTIAQKEAADPGEKLFDFEPVAVDLVGSRLPSRIVDQIISGEGVSDRSAALFGVSNAMLKAGFTDREILSVLTDPENYLGGVGYDHAQTTSRARAAEWVRRYTLEKSKRETLASKVFEDDVVIEDAPPLSEDEAATQAEEVLANPDWRELIERTSPESGYKPKNTLKNVILILQGEGGADVIRRDEFANSDVYGRSTPWGGVAGAEFTDIDTVRIKKWLADSYRFEPSDDRINQAVSSIADQNRFHPVRDYLDPLEWDGKSRLDTWMKRLLGAEAPEPYLSAVSRKLVVAMIARVYRPGVKYDQVVILEGSQGSGKSRSLRALTGPAWFTDATINVGDKDAILTMRSVWLAEMGELSGMSKADVNSLKEFISRSTDRIRVPYGKRSENFPRQCVFVGTTNQREYLKDTTGNRRFWPVKVGRCDVEGIEAERDQLFAEAKFAFDLGEPLWLEDAEMEDGAKSEQSNRMLHDVWEDMLLDWIARGADEEDEVSPRVDRSCFRTEDLFEGPNAPLSGWKPDPQNLRRCGDLLRKNGFESASLYDPSTKRSRRFWVGKPQNLTRGAARVRFA